MSGCANGGGTEGGVAVTVEDDEVEEIETDAKA